jgi:hypothetical protein
MLLLAAVSNKRPESAPVTPSLSVTFETVLVASLGKALPPQYFKRAFLGHFNKTVERQS